VFTLKSSFTPSEATPTRVTLTLGANRALLDVWLLCVVGPSGLFQHGEGRCVLEL